MRFVTLKLVHAIPRASITHTIDVWALVEIVSSILAVCLPSLRRFVRKHRVPAGHGKLLTSDSNESGRSASLAEYRESGEMEKVKVVPRVSELWLDRSEKGQVRDELWLQVPEKALAGVAR